MLWKRCFSKTLVAGAECFLDYDVLEHTLKCKKPHWKVWTVWSVYVQNVAEKIELVEHIIMLHLEAYYATYLNSHRQNGCTHIPLSHFLVPYALCAVALWRRGLFIGSWPENGGFDLLVKVHCTLNDNWKVHWRIICSMKWALNNLNRCGVAGVNAWQRMDNIIASKKFSVFRLFF